MDLPSVIALDMLHKHANGTDMATCIPASVIDECGYERTSINQPVMFKIEQFLGQRSIVTFSLKGTGTFECRVDASRQQPDSRWRDEAPTHFALKSFEQAAGDAGVHDTVAADLKLPAMQTYASFMWQDRFELPPSVLELPTETIGQIIMVIESQLFCQIEPQRSAEFCKLIWTEHDHFEQVLITE